MGRLVVGSLLAAAALFVWGFLFWATPLSAPLTAHTGETTALAEALTAALPGSGVYYLPDPSAGEEVFLEAHRAGPIATIYYRQEGAEAMAPGVFLLGYLHMALSALLIGLLLRAAAPALPGYGRRVAFVVVAGVAANVWAHLGQPIWFFHPWGHPLGTAVYGIVAWGLAGLVLARFAVPRAEAAAARAVAA